MRRRKALKGKDMQFGIVRLANFSESSQTDAAASYLERGTTV
jgi:hypothetical protein